MKIILPRLTLLLASLLGPPAIAQLPRVPNAERGAAAPASNVDAVSPGDRLIAQVVSQLERRESLAARLRYRVSLDGRRLDGAGSYWQQGSGETLRVRLELRVAEKTNLLQVSTGRVLWTDLTLPSGRAVSKVDLRQLRNVASQDEPEFGDISPGQATWSPIRPELTAESGGLPGLMSSLEEHFTFAPPQAMRWTPSPPLAGVRAEFPVFAVVGRWKHDQLLTLLPQLQNGNDPPSLPERVPQEVLLLIGQDDFFPYRIEYRRIKDPAVSQWSSIEPTTLQLSSDPLVMVEYFDVAFNAEIAVDQFDYSPGDVKCEDRTAEHLDKLRARQQFARRNGTESL